MDKPCPAAASGCHASLPSDPGAAASVAPGPTLSSTGAVSAFQRRVDSKKNAKKRHSFTALSVTHKSSQATSHRHSMEISAPVLISSSDPRAAARIGDLAHLSCSAPAQVTSSVRGQGGARCLALRSDDFIVSCMFRIPSPNQHEEDSGSSALWGHHGFLLPAWPQGPPKLW